jgi:DNA helicase-2/ATP-dependent DNA helicase PcrA
VRAQFQTREFEDRFISIGLAYRIVGGFRFYERAEIRDALAYLRLIAQPADDLAFERIYNTPSAALATRRWKSCTVSPARKHALAAAALAIVDTDELPARARNAAGADARSGAVAR